MDRVARAWWILLAVSACHGEPSEIPGDSPLAIAEFQVQESSSSLAITGVEASGAVIGRLRLDVGRFRLDDIDEGTSALVYGRQLEVEVLGQSARHESAGMDPRVLPPLPGPESIVINQFLYDPHVRPVLERWQIGLEDPLDEATTDDGALPDSPQPDQEEVPYTTCNFYTPSATGCAPTDCIISSRWAGQQFGQCKNVFEQIACCSANKTGVNRRCGYGVQGLANPCGTEGAGGCRVCWSQPYTSFCDVTASSEQQMGCCISGGQCPILHLEWNGLNWSHN